MAGIFQLNVTDKTKATCLVCQQEVRNTPLGRSAHGEKHVRANEARKTVEFYRGPLDAADRRRTVYRLPR